MEAQIPRRVAGGRGLSFALPRGRISLSTVTVPGSRASDAAALAAAALIAVVTLWPAPTQPQPGEVFCLVCGPLGGVDFLANVVLFLPLGVALAAGGRSPARALWMSAALSLAIEACQWRLVPGRDASAGDVLANSLGAVVGALAASHRTTLLRPSPQAARRLTAAWVVAISVVGCAASWAVTPAAPEWVYWSQWTPARRGYEPFTGSLRALSLDGVDIPVGTTIDPTKWTGGYAAGRLAIRALVVPGAPVNGVALIARAGNPLGEQFQLAQRGADLVVRGRTRSARAALRSPSFRLRDGLVAADTVPRVVTVEIGPGVVHLASAGTRDTVASVQQVTVGHAWKTVTPFEVADLRLAWLVQALWPCILFLPLGYWGAAAGSASARAAATLVALVMFLLVSPGAAGITIAGFPEGAGAVGGAVLGHLWQRRSGPARVTGGRLP